MSDGLRERRACPTSLGVAVLLAWLVVCAAGCAADGGGADASADAADAVDTSGGSGDVSDGGGDEDLVGGDGGDAGVGGDAASSPDVEPDAEDAADAAGEGDGDAEDAGPEVEIGSTGVEPEHAFTDITAELGLEGLKSSVISIADIDGDGWDDLLVGGNVTAGATATEVYRYNGDGGFEAVGLAERIGDAELLGDVVASTIVDLNKDGRMELVLGSYWGGEIQILWNRGELAFDATMAWSSDEHAGTKVTGFEAWDFNGDGFVDLFASMKWPSMRLFPWSDTHDNVLLLNEGTESFADVGSSLADALECGRKQTFSSLVMPRGAFELEDVLFVANDMAGNCAWRMTGGFPIPDFEPVADPAEVLEELSFSMGADFQYEDDTGELLVLATDLAIHLAYRVDGSGVQLEPGFQIDHGSNYFGWGVALFDADNDGDQDAVVATGITSTNEQITAFSAQLTPYDDSVLVSRIHYVERQADGTFADANEVGGPAFAAETGEWYGVSRADFDRDGCVDVVVGVRQAFDGDDFFEPDDGEYDPSTDTVQLLAPGLRVLKNNCKPSANRWVGLKVPDVPGTLVALERSDGHTVYDVVKGTVGVGSRSGGGHVHFGLGTDLEVVSVTVYDPKGEVMATLGALEAGAYHPIP